MIERRIRIGNQSAAAAEPWDLPWRFALAQGFDAFEWFPDPAGGAGGWASSDIPRRARQRIRRAARAADLCLSLHVSLQASLVSSVGQTRLFEDLRLASELGARLLNLHLDLGAGVPQFVRALAPLVHHLGSAEMALALENTPHDGPEALNAVYRELRAAGLLARGSVGFCLDMGHANLHLATRNDYLGFVDALDRDLPIVHVHAHENHGDQDSHLTLFTGPSGQDPAGLEGLLARLRRRGFAGSIILEQWPRPPELLIQARDRLRRIIAEQRSLRARPRK